MADQMTQYKRDRAAVRNCSPELLPGLIAAHPYKLQHVRDPTAELVEFAMEVNSACIQYHPNPSEEQKLAALADNCDNYRHIKRPTREMFDIGWGKIPTDAQRMMSIRANADAIIFVARPTKEMIDLALEIDSDCLRDIEGTSEAQKLAAIAKCGDSIRHVENPTDAMKFAAIENDAHSISYFVEGSPYAIEAEIRRRETLDPTWSWDGETDLHEGPTEAMKLRAVELDGTALEHLRSPSDSLVVQAVKTSPSIVFCATYESLITTDLLNQIQPGLANSLELIKELTPNFFKRNELFRIAFESGAEVAELPTDLDSAHSF